MSGLLELNMVNSEVPCNGCTRCCHGDAIRLLPADDAARWVKVQIEVGRDEATAQLSNSFDKSISGELAFAASPGVTINPAPQKVTIAPGETISVRSKIKLCGGRQAA